MTERPEILMRRTPLAELAGALERELARAIAAQQRVIREVPAAFLDCGHWLVRGVPGVA